MFLIILSYFQQYVNYNIKASFDDSLNTLYGEEVLIYKNNSNDDLDTIYFNMYYNSMRLNSRLHNDLKKRGWNIPIKKKSLGYIRINEFKYDTFEIKQYNDSSDIMMIVLPEPIKPGETKRFNIKFELKVPFLYTRFGKSGNHIIFAYWYPQISCYDNEGWHIDGYRMEGEFYNEFGDYYVEIDFPSKYILFGTGEMMGEEKFLSNIEKIVRGEEIDTFGRTKAIFKAKNVHDFTWFIDKNVIVKKTNVDDIEIYVVFNKSEKKIWKDIPDKVARIVKTFNEWIGKYPYKNLIVFSSPIIFGGMEYPNMVSIGRYFFMIPFMRDLRLEEVIAHEIAHQWFYGVLGNNEMDYSFLDESFATFYEQKYMKTYYPDSIRKYKYYYMRKNNKELYLYENSREREPVIGKKPYEMNKYYLLAYNKGSTIIEYLNEVLGEERFNMFIREYFELCKFAHPAPNDFLIILSSYMGQKKIKEIKKLLYSTENFDYSIEIKDNDITLKKKNIDLPIPIRIETDEKTIDTIIYNKISFYGNIHSVSVDPKNTLVETDEWNNTIPKKINFKLCFCMPDDITALNIAFLPLIYKSTNYYYGFGTSISQTIRHNSLGYLTFTKDGDYEYFLKLREDKFYIITLRRKYIGLDRIELNSSTDILKQKIDYNFSYTRYNNPLNYPKLHLGITTHKKIIGLPFYLTSSVTIGSFNGDEFIKGNIGLSLRFQKFMNTKLKIRYTITKGETPWTEKIYLEGSALYEPSYNFIIPFNNYSSPLARHFSSGDGLNYYGGKKISGEKMIFFDLSTNLYLLNPYFRVSLLDRKIYYENGISMNMGDFNMEIPFYPFDRNFYLNWVVRL